MGGLNGSLSIAIGALLAEQGALDATTNNVANANTPGYTRKRPILVENPPLVLGDLTFGSGVSLQGLESIRDPILQLRIQQETQQGGQLDAFVKAMRQVEVMFNNTSGGDIGTRISNFFNSLDQLSTAPSNLSLRQAVLTAGSNLAGAFNTAANNLQVQRNNLNLDVTQAVQQVNTLTSQIAKANREIADLENVQRDASPFIDQRDQLIEQLSNLIDVASVRTESGLTLTTSTGTALVASAQSFPLTTQPDLSGAQHIFAQGADITAQISSGKLAGLLQARDQRIPGLLTSLDSLAAGFATAINTAHQNGFDLGGDMGGVFFAAPPAGGVGAAASMAVAITDPSLIAASSDGNPGSNGNLLALSAVHDLAVTAGATATDFYSNLVFAIGGDVANGTADQEASALVLQQLQDQRGSISGVSLDEEAANMLVFQRAYDAAARVVSAINEMMTVAVNLGR